MKVPRKFEETLKPMPPAQGRAQWVLRPCPSPARCLENQALRDPAIPTLSSRIWRGPSSASRSITLPQGSLEKPSLEQGGPGSLEEEHKSLPT